MNPNRRLRPVVHRPQPALHCIQTSAPFSPHHHTPQGYPKKKINTTHFIQKQTNRPRNQDHARDIVDFLSSL
jgi:hypothetical protein